MSKKRKKKDRKFKCFTLNELRLISDSLVAYKALYAMKLSNLYREYFDKSEVMDTFTEDIQKANFEWPDKDDFCNEIEREISTREVNED